MTIYNNKSPYFLTRTVGTHLDILNIRAVSSNPDDFLYTIQPQYTYRPDLLAHDLYGDARLWWVFIQRNLDILQDPILDFVPGTQIYVCKLSELSTALGI
jgi:hypothetical protein